MGRLRGVEGRIDAITVTMNSKTKLLCNSIADVIKCYTTDFSNINVDYSKASESVAHRFPYHPIKSFFLYISHNSMVIF